MKYRNHLGETLCGRCGEPIEDSQSRIMETFFLIENLNLHYCAQAHRTCREENIKNNSDPGYSPYEAWMDEIN